MTTTEERVAQFKDSIAGRGFCYPKIVSEFTEHITQQANEAKQALAEQASRHTLEKEEAVENALASHKEFSNGLYESLKKADAECHNLGIRLADERRRVDQAVQEALAKERKLFATNMQGWSKQAKQAMKANEEEIEARVALERKNWEAYREGEAERVKEAVAKARDSDAEQWEQYAEAIAKKRINEYAKRCERTMDENARLLREGERQRVEAARREVYVACMKFAKDKWNSCNDTKERAAYANIAEGIELMLLKCKGPTSPSPVSEPERPSCSWFTIKISRWGFQVEDINPWRPQ